MFSKTFEAKKKTYKEFLVLHLVKISKELIPDFYWSKNHWNKVYDYSESICYFWINILFAVSLPQVHVNTLIISLIFFPVINISQTCRYQSLYFVNTL